MEMLLRNVSIEELKVALDQGRDQSPVPELESPDVVSRARSLAKANGIWDRIDRGLDPARPIPVIRRSVYRLFERTGDRDVGQKAMFDRANDTDLAFLALWLGHPKADIDYLQDLLWAACDDFEWQLPAHEKFGSIDLVSAANGARFAVMLRVLGFRLEAEVRDRVRAEIERRVFGRYRDPANRDYWRTHHNNWNHVCNGSIVRAAILLISDNADLARTIHPMIQNMTYALDGFADDGGCWEGPGYWGYGFGHFMEAARMLRSRTGGAVNLMEGEKIERICRYPLTAWIERDVAAPFSDVSPGYLPASLALLVNDFMAIPELFDFCRRNPDGSLAVHGMLELALCAAGKPGGTGRPLAARSDGSNRFVDHHLPVMGQVKLWGGPGPRRMALAALAGNNGVSHNHNDIGTFVVYRGGRLLLTDPGAPIYKRGTFGPLRYENLFCSSLGHSVPVIEGEGQPAGRQYSGAMTVANLNGMGLKRVAIDMSRAYAVKNLTKLVRTLELDAPRNRLRLEDTFQFRRTPRMVEERFVTFEDVKVISGGSAVRIGPARGGLLMRAVGCAGRFRVDALVKESREGRTGKVLNRIAFKPRKLEHQMALRFELV